MNYFANNEINMHLPAMYSIQSELLMSLLPYEINLKANYGFPIHLPLHFDGAPVL